MAWSLLGCNIDFSLTGTKVIRSPIGTLIILAILSKSGGSPLEWNITKGYAKNTNQKKYYDDIRISLPDVELNPEMKLLIVLANLSSRPLCPNEKSTPFWGVLM